MVVESRAADCGGAVRCKRRSVELTSIGFWWPNRLRAIQVTLGVWFLQLTILAAPGQVTPTQSGGWMQMSTLQHMDDPGTAETPRERPVVLLVEDHDDT